MTTDEAARTIAHLAPQIVALMSNYMRLHHSPVVREAVQSVLQQLGTTDRPRKQQLQFLMLAAPIARRVALELSNSNECIRIGKCDVSYGDIRSCVRWINATDPMCAKMVDLHYFCGISVRETAATVGMPPLVVIRDLRFAKSLLRIRLQ